MELRAGFALALLVSLTAPPAFGQTDTFSVQTTDTPTIPPTLEPTDIFSSNDCRDKAQQRTDLRLLDDWSRFFKRFADGFDREIADRRGALMQTSCARDAQFRSQVQQYSDVARRYNAQARMVANDQVQCYRSFIAASCTTEFRCSVRTPPAPPVPPSCPGWPGTGNGRPIGRIDTGLPPRPGETTQFPGLVVQLCNGILKIELDRDMNVNLRKGTMVTFSLGGNTQTTVGRKPITGRGNADWNAVTVQFYPETGVATNVEFRGPGPANWTRVPCSNTVVDGPSPDRSRDVVLTPRPSSEPVPAEPKPSETVWTVAATVWTVDANELLKVMDTCLLEHFPGFSRFGKTEMDTSSASYRTLTNAKKVFVLAGRVADHAINAQMALAAENGTQTVSEWGQNLGRRPLSETSRTALVHDYLIGWSLHCLIIKQAIPEYEETRNWGYADFAGGGSSVVGGQLPSGNERDDAMLFGQSNYGLPPFPVSRR